MRFAVSAAALLAFASSALAQTPNFDPITSPTKDEDVKAGSTFDIVWQPSSSYSGTVTLGLLGGSSPSTLSDVGTIASGVDNSAGNYSWAVSSTLGTASTYGIQITLDSDKTVFQYSFPFQITGGSGNSSSASTSASGTVTLTLSSVNISSTAYSTSTASGNLSTTATSGPSKVTKTLTATGGSQTTGSSSVPTSGAGSVAVGSLAMLGGVALAAFAL